MRWQNWLDWLVFTRRPRPYDAHILRLLETIAQTPTGAPLVAYVHRRWPRIEWGTPPVGTAFTFPWPIEAIIMRDTGDEASNIEVLAHELAHMARWRGHIVGSLEQEYDAYLTGVRVRAEWEGLDWRDPSGPATERWPLLFGPDASPKRFMEWVRTRNAFYALLPWRQPRTLPELVQALARQIRFGVCLMMKKKCEETPKTQTAGAKD
nr:hypothetical protein [Ardenticatena sp.]